MNIVAKAARSLILIYKRTFSPSLLSTCRFTPTCSHYALEAIERHGVVVGGALAAWRILRCNPFTRGGGLDTVPMQLVILRPALGRRIPITLPSTGVSSDRHEPAKLSSHSVRTNICPAGEVARDGALN